MTCDFLSIDRQECLSYCLRCLSCVICLICCLLCGCATEHAVNPSSGSSQLSVGEFIFIPASNFIMGSPAGQFDYNESPAHQITLPGYYIGVFEVTNREYAAFLSDSTGDAHWDYRMEITKSGSRFQPVAGREKLPVSYVTWRDAEAYSAWLGGRLPSEAEWEKAARGPNDRRQYPWGDYITGNEANFANIGGGLWNVGDAPGKSVYGCADMAGNVWEWTADWYDSLYYNHTPVYDPRGPSTGREKTIRGGSFLDNELAVRCSRRYGILPDARFVYLGFRCAMDSAAYENRRGG